MYFSAVIQLKNERGWKAEILRTRPSPNLRLRKLNPFETLKGWRERIAATSSTSTIMPLLSVRLRRSSYGTGKPLLSLLATLSVDCSRDPPRNTVTISPYSSLKRLRQRCSVATTKFFSVFQRLKIQRSRAHATSSQARHVKLNIVAFNARRPCTIHNT